MCCLLYTSMIAGNEAPQRPEDSETQLARIGHRLARLYQIMQENRLLVDEERQELQALVSDISHQVKTPVSNLKMATDTLLEKPMTEAERTDFIRGIRSQTDKLDFLFQACLLYTSYGDPGHGEDKLHCHPAKQPLYREVLKLHFTSPPVH